MSLKRVSVGDPVELTAAAYNAWCDAAEDLQNRRLTQGGRLRPEHRDPDVVLVRNDSGVDVGRFGVLGIAGPIITPTANLDEFKRWVTLSGVTPTSDHVDSFVVLLEPLASGAVGEAVISGVVQVQVYVVDEMDTVCGAISGDNVELRSGIGSNLILWRESGSGRKWALVSLRAFRQFERFLLTDNLYECSTATAYKMDRNGLMYTTSGSGASHLIADTFAAVPISPVAKYDAERGEYYIPAGTCLNARFASDNLLGVFWEAIDFSACACESDSSSSGGSQSSSESSESSSSPSSSLSSESEPSESEPSESEPSESEPSSSEPSSSEPSSSEPSSSEPSSSESSSSESSSSESSSSESSGSESSGSEPSGSEPSESESSGSDKSTAIVPASWSPTGFTALFVAECPEVRFDDVIVAEVPIEDGVVGIDPRIIEVCEKGSLEVCGATSDIPIIMGAKIVDNAVRLRFAKYDPSQKVRVVLRLTGIRKGFRRFRFPDRTQKQFEQNERFINSAYDHE